MAELSAQAQALLRSQRRRYLARLPRKADELEALWALVPEAGPANFLEAVHRLAGSAGLHGLDRIQASAASLEAELKTHLGEPERYETEVRALIASLLDSGEGVS